MATTLRRAFVWLTLSLSASVGFAETDLLQVYQDALKNDPTYLAAKTTYLSAMQDAPIARGALLPSLSLDGGSSGLLGVSSTHTTGDLATNRDDTTSEQNYGVALNLTQPIFNYADFQSFKESKNNVKAAAATFYNAQQDLMLTVSNDYFAVLEDEEVVRYTESNVEANKRSLDQAKQQYDVGLNTQTDVYSAQAAYSSAISENVSAKNTLADDLENLSALTGKTYKDLAKLSKNFPLVKPNPASITDWTKVAIDHNWNLQSYHYSAMAAMDEIKVQYGGHLPDINLSASYSHNYSDTNDHESSSNSGNEFTDEKSASITMDFPLFSGGTVSYSVKQAEYDYQTAVHDMELQYRTVTTDTRQDYLNVISDISAINADKSSIQSNMQALKGLEAGYKVGTQTMVDVINQQSLLFQAQQDYATDRFDYVDNLISLKYDAGILSVEDLVALNGWLGNAPAAKQKDKSKQTQLQILDTKYKGDGPVAPTVDIPVQQTMDTNDDGKKKTTAVEAAVIMDEDQAPAKGTTTSTQPDSMTSKKAPEQMADKPATNAKSDMPTSTASKQAPADNNMSDSNTSPASEENTAQTPSASTEQSERMATDEDLAQLPEYTQSPSLMNGGDDQSTSDATMV